MMNHLVSVIFLITIGTQGILGQILGNWTFFSGLEQNVKVTFGTKNVPNSSNFPGSRVASVSYTDSCNDFYLFGGVSVDERSYSATYADLWKFSNPTSASPTWTWISGTNKTNFQGYTGSKGVGDINNYPGARYYAAGGGVPKQNTFWVYGGVGYLDGTYATIGLLNDLWKYETTSMKWTLVAGAYNSTTEKGNYGQLRVADSGNMPPHRWGSSLAVDNVGNVWMFGGIVEISGYVVSNDLWKFDINLNNWVWMSGSQTNNVNGSYGTKGVEISSNSPPSRSGHHVFYDSKNCLWVFGGAKQDTADWLNDLWRFDTTKNLWTWISGSSITDVDSVYGQKGITSSSSYPGGRWNAIGWIDTYDNFWIYSGRTTYSFMFDDVWKWDGQNWTWMAGSSSPNAPYYYQTKGVAGPLNTPGPKELPINFIDEKNNLWIYSGQGTLNGNTFLSSAVWFFNTNNIPLIVYEYCPSRRLTTGITSADITTGVTSKSISTGITTKMISTGITSKDISTGVTSKDLSTGVTSKDLSTGVTSKDLSTGVTSKDISTGVTSKDLSTGLTTKMISTGVTSKDLSTGVTSKDISTGVTSKDISTGVTSKDLSTGVTTKIISTGVTSKDLSTGVTSKDLSTGATSKDISTGVTSKDISTGITTKMISTGVTSKDLSTGVTSKDLSTGVTSKDISTGVTSKDISTGVTSKDISTGVTSADLSTGVTSADLSTGVTSADLSTGVTSADISTGVTSADLSTGITSADISTGVTSLDISTGVTSKDISTQDVTTRRLDENDSSSKYEQPSDGGSQDTGKSKNTAIIGGVVGGAAGIGLVGAAAAFLVKKKSKPKSADTFTESVNNLSNFGTISNSPVFTGNSDTSNPLFQG